ncbi:unnamed protein product [Caenorhabditis sp. 36 PRJEB53466]|nr:unnamed protein product [Caenorhabditis sp. 36 PRJEB53466]
MADGQAETDCSVHADVSDVSQDKSYQRKRIPAYTTEDREGILSLLAEHAKREKRPIALTPIWVEYIKKNGSMRAPASVNWHFRHSIAPKLHLMTQFDEETRVLMFIATTTPIAEKFLKELRDNEIVEVDENGFITKYRDIELSDVHSKSMINIYTSKETDQILKFIEEKAKAMQTWLPATDLWKECAEESGVKRSALSVANRFRITILPKIYIKAEYDTELKVKILFITRSPVDTSFLKALKETAEVRVDGKGRISMYKGNGLTLLTEKKASGLARKRSQHEENGQGTNSGIRDRIRRAENYEEKEEIPKNTGDKENLLKTTKDEGKEEEPVDQKTMIGGMEMFMDSLKGMFEKQTLIMERLLNKEESTASKRKFLQSMRTLILTMNDPELGGALQRVDDALQKLGNRDERIPMRSIRSALEPVLKQF